MNGDWLDKTYYSNTAEQWLKALLIIVAVVVIARLGYLVFGKIARRFTSKTAYRLDDILIDMIEEPAIFLFIWYGAWYGLGTLTLPDGLVAWTDKIFNILIILTVGWLAVRLFEALYREYVIPFASKTESDLDDQLLPLVRKLTKMVIWAMTIIIALDNSGYDVGALLAGLGIGGLALAMAAKDTVSNIFGGFTIFADKPFKLRDRIKVVGFDGTVREIGLRSTRLETLDGRIVTIPNAKFADTPVENVSMEPSRKVVNELGLTYDTTPEKMELAMQLLQRIARENPDLEEKVVTAFTSFGDFALILTFTYYIKSGADIFGVQTTVNMAVLREFNANGLEFAFPTQTLYTKAI